LRLTQGECTPPPRTSGDFGGLAPLDTLLRGRVDHLDAAFEAMDSSVFVKSSTADRHLP